MDINTINQFYPNLSKPQIRNSYKGNTQYEFKNVLNDSLNNKKIYIDNDSDNKIKPCKTYKNLNGEINNKIKKLNKNNQKAEAKTNDKDVVSDSETKIIVKSDGSKDLLLITKVGEMKLCTSIKLSGPTNNASDVKEQIHKAESVNDDDNTRNINNENTDIENSKN